MFFISCDVTPDDFGSEIRCPNFSGGNAQIFTESELEQIFLSNTNLPFASNTTFISCDIQPDDFGSLVRCPNFSGGNAQVFTQTELQQIFEPVVIVPIGNNSSCDPLIDQGCISHFEFLSVFTFSMFFIAYCFGFQSAKNL